MSETLERPLGKLGGRFMPDARNPRQDSLDSNHHADEAGPEQLNDAPLERSALMFDPWLGTIAQLAHGPVPFFVERYLELAGQRQRRMKGRDRENLEAVIYALLANLAYAIVRGHEPPSVAVSIRAATRKLTRYDRRGFGLLPRVLETLADVGEGVFAFKFQKSSTRGVASSVTAGPLIKRAVEAQKIKLHHFYREPGAELILLSRTSVDRSQRRKDYEWIDYPDIIEAIHFRNQMERINAALRRTKLTMEDDGGPPMPTGMRELKRFFKLLPDDPERPPRFDQGGRLFGGWWQSLPKARRAAIRIEDEPVADIDFSNMFLRLAYLEANEAPPDGDLYVGIPGFSDPQWRDGVKVVVSAMLFRVGPMTRLPAVEGLRERLPPGTKGRDIRAAILAAHPLLEPIFEKGLGFRLMFRESEILIGAITRLLELDIPSLPMHDGLMVPRSRAQEAATVMRSAAAGEAGSPLPISLKILG